MTARSVSLLLLVTLLSAGPAAADLLPSEATTLMIRAIQHAPTAERRTLTAPIAARIDAPGPSDVERFLTGEAHFINFEPEPARDAFWAFRERNDDFGRVAWQRLMIIRINAFGMVDELIEHDIPEYRRRFQISPHDRAGISYPIMQTANALVRRGDVDRALDLVVDEVRRHSRFDAPYAAYRLPASFIGLAAENDRGDEFRELHRRVVDGIDKAIAARIDTRSEPSRLAYAIPGATLGTLFDDQRRGFHDWTAEFLKLRDWLAAQPVD